MSRCDIFISPFRTSVIPPHKLLVSWGKSNSPLLLALCILNLYELVVLGFFPLLFVPRNRGSGSQSQISLSLSIL